jgi:hypothetical protein
MKVETPGSSACRLDCSIWSTAAWQGLRDVAVVAANVWSARARTSMSDKLREVTTATSASQTVLSYLVKHFETEHRTAMVSTACGQGGSQLDRGLQMRRWLLAGVVLAFPIAGSVVVGSQAALAASGVSCTSLTGTVNTSTDVAKVKLSGCNDTKNTGGKGTTTSSETATSSTIKWNGTGTTTLGMATTTAVSPSTCPSGDIEEMTTATVTEGTGAAAKSIKKGWTSQSYVCYDPTTSTLSLAPGTTYQIGKGL